MKSLINPHIFSKGQSFLFFSSQSSWEAIVNDAKNYYKAPPFETVEIGSNGTITIEEARFIQSESLKPPTQSDIRLCIIYSIDKATEQAANALLKVIEEPSPNTRFILLAVTKNVLPTIASRCIKHYIFNHDSQNTIELLPLEKDTDFATVSLRIAELVASGESQHLIQQWTRDLVNKGSRIDAMHWLVEIGHRIETGNVNVVALLEVTYLHLTRELALPADIERYLYKHHGHI